ncbi:MAG: hypothetical protein B7Y03_15565 [Polaromonas sp. 24-62-144]|nr:MAG: hypothetical protein B7Y03_15565 [Polaromonas sp. 24-62-144]
MKSTHNTAWAYAKGTAITVAMVTGTAVLMAACATVGAPPKEYTQELLDPMVQVPAGNVVVLETTATGLLNYECRANPAEQGAIGWVLVSPQAELVDRSGKTVAKYSGPPATWTHMDGSSVVGTQIAFAPRLGSTGAGVLQNVTYIQRIKTKGGQDLSKACAQQDKGDKLTLPYQADYIFWKAG